MKRRSLLIAAAAAACVFAAPITAEAATPGWNSVDGNWFYANQEGNYVYDQWVDGGQYYMTNTGVMAADGSYWTCTETKDEATGEVDWTSAYYVFNEKGVVVKTPGWVHAGTNWYWVNEKGYAGNVCTKEDCTNLSEAGWVKDAGKWYYVEQDGRMVTDYKDIVDNPEADYKDQTSTRYWFKPDGEMITGWYNYDPTSTYGSWVYCDANGAGHDGWLSDGGNWYYLADGRLRTNGIYVTGETPSTKDFTDANGNVDYDAYNKAYEEYCASHRYYFDRKGVMVYGWYHFEYTDSLGNYSDAWYYTNPNSGVVWDGWLKDGDTWYFINGGQMVRNGRICDDENAPKFEQERPNYSDYKDAEGMIDWDKYYDARRAYEIAYNKYQDELKAYYDTHYFIFNDKGAMVTGWYSITDTYGTDWYYADANGVGRTGWLKDGDNWYYINRGVMLTNCYTPDGYYVDANGICK